MKHIVFFDGDCGFCNWIVQIILKQDREEIFAFAPLQGETAKEKLQQIPEEYKGVDSLVLILDHQSKGPKTLIQGKAGLRIAWELGGLWTLIGWLSFLPSAPFDAIYRLIARNRQKLGFNQQCPVPNEQTRQRFLP